MAPMWPLKYEVTALIDDYHETRARGVTRPPPEKGLRRSVLCASWLGVHIFTLVVGLGYGAELGHAALFAWWLIFTTLAGVGYLRLVFSNPGFVSARQVQGLLDAQGVDVAAIGSAGARGELLPVAEGAAAGATAGVELELATCQRGEGGEGNDGARDERAGSSAAHAAEPDVEGGLGPGAPAELAGLEREYFSGYSEQMGMMVPVRAKYCKKHGRVVAKFDHYCYAMGNSVGELNHGQFWRFLVVQVISIWLGKALVDHGYATGSGLRAVWWSPTNWPLVILDILAYVFGITLAILLLMHTYMACTSTTTYEFLKLEKLSYLEGFYEFSCPFSEGLVENLRHFCCPAGIKLWRRPAPESEWPESFWRNRYYSCFG